MHNTLGRRIRRLNLALGDAAVDVVANIGYYTVWASKPVGEGGRVFAVEAGATIRGKLVDNFSRNGIQWVAVAGFGAWHGEAN